MHCIVRCTQCIARCARIRAVRCTNCTVRFIHSMQCQTSRGHASGNIMLHAAVRCTRCIVRCAQCIARCARICVEVHSFHVVSDVTGPCQWPCMPDSAVWCTHCIVRCTQCIARCARICAVSFIHSMLCQTSRVHASGDECLTQQFGALIAL
jgi:hypothetical protein